MVSRSSVITGSVPSRSQERQKLLAHFSMRTRSWIRYEQTTRRRAVSMPRRATDRLTLGAPHSGNAAQTKRARSANYTLDRWFRRTGMNFQRVLVGLVILLAAGLAAS